MNFKTAMWIVFIATVSLFVAADFYRNGTLQGGIHLLAALAVCAFLISLAWRGAKRSVDMVEN